MWCEEVGIDSGIGSDIAVGESMQVQIYEDNVKSLRCAGFVDVHDRRS